MDGLSPSFLSQEEIYLQMDHMGGRPKNRGVSPKMDGLYNGKNPIKMG